MAQIDDRPDEARRLEQARIARGFKTARAACDYFGWNYATYTQHESGLRGLGRAVSKYAKAYRTKEAWIQYGTGDGPGAQVPLKGYIGAGQAVEAVEADPEATIDAPAERTPDTVAAIVRGNSMMPAFRDGWIIYWSRQVPPADMVNDLAVVQLESGEIYVKVLRPGSKRGLWTLQSLNQTVEDITDKAVSWAAKIDWIKPR